MGIWVIVQRGNGEFRGPAVIDALITSDHVAIEKGRNLLDNSTIVASSVDMTTVHRTGVVLGQLIKVMDALQGVSWFGKIIGIRHFQQLPKAPRTTLTVEKI